LVNTSKTKLAKQLTRFRDAMPCKFDATQKAVKQQLPLTFIDVQGNKHATWVYATDTLKKFTKTLLSKYVPDEAQRARVARAISVIRVSVVFLCTERDFFGL